MSLLVEDRELLRRFRAGEASALKKVYMTYAPDMAKLLRRGFSFAAGEKGVRFAGYHTWFELEDALQEVFRRAFSEHARMTYDGLRPFRAYLHTIARNVVINAFEATRRRKEISGFEQLESVPAESDWSAADHPLDLGDDAATGRPDRNSEARELRELVAKFAGGLDERERTVFEQRFVQGLSHQEITATTGISASKIKTAEARIRQAMLRYLRPHGYLRHVLQKAAPQRATYGERS